MTPSRAGSRRRSREVALQVLYALDLAPDAVPDAAAAEDAFERAAAHFELPEGARSFARALVRAVCQRRDELDAWLRAHSTNWRVERMPAVDRNVLRIAVLELVSGQAPPEVVIDEAIELARRFGGEQSPAFVNGVLDAITREVRAEAG